MEKAIVLVSGGLDSAVCLANEIAIRGAKNVIGLNMFYGQKHDKEAECARKICQYYNIPIFEVDLSEVFKFSDCPLLKKNEADIPKGDYAEQKAKDGVVSTYVPFRNGLFLSYATALAYSLNAERIVYGAHADDAAGGAYPDCTPSFRDAMADAVSIGTGRKVQLYTPLIFMNKGQVVARGRDLNVPFELTWSCYEGEDKACGKCSTCIDRLRAFKNNGMEDPIEYKGDVQ